MKASNFLGKAGFMVLLLAATIAFFLYKQYMFSFLALVLMLVVSKWDRVKKLIAGRGRVEMQIEREKKEK